MIRARCPVCDQVREIGSLDDLPTFPFCSERCRLVDLGRWIDGDYVIPGGNQASSDAAYELPADPDESEE